MGELPHEVRVSSTLRTAAGTSLQLSRVLGRVGLVVFSALTLVAFFGSVMRPAAERTREDIVAGGLALVIFGSMALVSWWLLRRSSPGSAHRRLLESPVALRITATSLEFPEAPGQRPAESWPLTETRTERTEGHAPVLRFLRDGHQPRQLPAHAIDEPLEQVHARILAAQRALHRPDH